MSVYLSSLSNDNQIALQVVGERMSAWLPFRTTAKWLSRCSGREPPLGFPLPQPPNGSPSGLGENVCLAPPPPATSKWLSRWSGRECLLGFPFPQSPKWLSRWSGRERLLGFPLPQPPNGFPGGLGESVCSASLPHNLQMAFRVVWERMFAWLPSHTAAKWLSKWSGIECLLGFLLPQPPNGFPGGLGENVCLAALSHSRQMAFQVVWGRTSALLPFPTTAKWLSWWPGRKRLLGFPPPQPPNRLPAGLGENVCLAFLSHNRQMALQVVWDRTSAWSPSPAAAKWLSRRSGRERLLGFPFPQPPNGFPGGLGKNVCLVSFSYSRQMGLQVVWERTSASFPSPTTAKWLSKWSGRERLLGFPLPKPPNGSPGGLGESVCLVSLPRSSKMAPLLVWERVSAWSPLPHGRHLSFKTRLCMG